MPRHVALVHGITLAELEKEINRHSDLGYDMQGIVTQVTNNGRPVLIMPMIKYVPAHEPPKG